MTNDEHIILGEREDWGARRLFGISQADLRYHAYVVGKTGSGKTTLLKNIIVQHFNLGRGISVIDPHGDLALDLLNFIPSWRTNDVVYFDAGDTDFPIAFNPLAGVKPENRHLVASGIVTAFKGLWRDSWGPRSEYLLYNSIAALLESRNPTLLGVSRLLTDSDYRAKIVHQISDPFLRAFWIPEFESYEERFRQEMAAPILNKVGQFILNPVIRNILGQVKSKVSIPFVMDNRRIFIANLSKGRLGEDKSNLLGSLLVTQFQLAAMGRSTQPEQDRQDHVLVIDEFQNFSTDSFAPILSEARKYKLSLLPSNQYVDQLSACVRHAIFGNVGTILSFRVGFTDAEILEKEFKKAFLATALTDLGAYEVIAKLSEEGTISEPFKAKTRPCVQSEHHQKSKILRFSRERFAVPRCSIEKKWHRWLPTD